MVEMDGIGPGNVRTPLTALRVDPVPTPELLVALGALLDRAIEAQRADFGAIRLYQPSRHTLRLAVHRNFDPAMIDSVMEMPVDSAAMRAFTHGRVIIEDLYGDAGFEMLRPLSEKLGVRAVQFSPIVTRSGDRLGLLATHFKRPHSPSPFSLAETDRIVATAAEIIELWGHADHSPARMQQDAGVELRETFILALKAAPPRPGSFALPQDIARLLERSTETYATRRRRENATPAERVVELKQMLREIDDSIAVEFRRDVSSDVIRWAIQAYYRPAPKPA
jgi:GAF domain-containing protein